MGTDRVKQHPYSDLPERAYWKRSVGAVPREAVDPVADLPFRIGAADRVATAGSCFAQHIARHLKSSGFTYLVTEKAHPLIHSEVAEAAGYGLFTARYGNIYTPRQLLQLFLRCYDEFTPRDDIWTGPEDRPVDAFRPTVQPGGFASVQELAADREHHLACVRAAFEGLDVLVFTLGLTECWLSRQDGAAYPVCPGVSGGQFDPAAYAFHNLRVEEVVADLSEFIARLRRVNPAAKIILTVSPVPLAATASANHVLTATTLSKAILRVAADIVCGSNHDCAYFPSYEIITGNYTRGAYYADDLRNVTDAGVGHVMRLFLKHGTVSSSEAPRAGQRNESENDRYLKKMRDFTKVMCDESALDP
jgi:hypothetical protein